MTPTVLLFDAMIPALEEVGRRLTVEQTGADGFAPDASAAVRVATKSIGI